MMADRDLNIEKMKLKVILQEFAHAQEGSKQRINLEITTFSMFITAIGALFAFGGDFSPRVSFFLFAGLMPCFSVLFGMIWIDNVTKQNKLAVYVSAKEKQINEMFSDNPELLGWEKWYRRETFIHSSKPYGEHIGKSANRWFFIGAPIASWLWVAVQYFSKLVIKCKEYWKYASKFNFSIPDPDIEIIVSDIICCLAFFTALGLYIYFLVEILPRFERDTKDLLIRAAEQSLFPLDYKSKEQRKILLQAARVFRKEDAKETNEDKAIVDAWKKAYKEWENGDPSSKMLTKEMLEEKRLAMGKSETPDEAAQ